MILAQIHKWIGDTPTIHLLYDAFYNYFTTGCFKGLMEMIGSKISRTRKPGRPRAIPVDLEPAVVELYRQGYGYRAITRILRNEHGLNPHFSSIRKALLRLGEVARK